MKHSNRNWTVCKLKTAALLLAFALAPVFSLAAQQPARPYWFVLEEGKRNFSAGAYGEALLDFEDARNIRFAMYSRMEQDMIEVLSIGEVRRYRDNLNLVDQYVNEHGQYRAREALDELYYRVGRETLGGSVQRALDSFKALKEYPEADFWIGETYRLEGELAISEKQYRKALQNRRLLESPGFAVEIQYHLANILKERRRFQDMEDCYADILKNDVLWQESEKFVRQAMSRTLKTEGINRFLTMYRYKNPATEKAHRNLGLYYLSSGRHNKALDHLMFAVLIQNSTIIEEQIRKQFDFSFVSLENLRNSLERRKELKQYMNDVDYYQTLYSLAAASFANGEETAAHEIWRFLAAAPEAGEWSQRSKIRLTNPQIEDSF
ncbi:MAG: hypothetical protein LBD20_04375 [Spirochaetaceae bacterium]|jgi:hypothetical protein|nr:hypothetical protein [Spirochaetaceae bacterium]